MKLLIVISACLIAHNAAFSSSQQDGNQLRAVRQHSSENVDGNLQQEKPVMVNKPKRGPGSEGWSYGHYRKADQESNFKANKRADAAEDRADEAEARAEAAEAELAAMKKKDAKLAKDDEKEEKKEEEEAQELKGEEKKAKKSSKGKLREPAKSGGDHRNFATGFVITIIFLSILIMMAHSRNKVIAKHTWKVLDFIVCMFLAMEWYIVVKHGLDYFKFSGFERILCHAALSVTFLLIALFVSWHLKKGDDEEEAGMFDGIFGHMVMWVAAGLTETIQMEAGGKAMVGIAILFIMLWYALLSFLVTLLMTKQTKKGWGDGQVTKMTAAALAGGFVGFMHMVISGSFQTMSGPHPNPPTLTETLIMLALSAVYIGLDIFAKPVIEKKAKASNYWTGRTLADVAAIIDLLPRFSLLASFGHLIVEHSGFPSGSTEAMLALTVSSTVVGIVFLLLSTIRGETDPVAAILIGLGGWMIGGAWAKLFDNECNQLVKSEGGSHPFLEKLTLVIVISSFLFPAYAFYLKPLIMEKEAGK